VLDSLWQCKALYPSLADQKVSSPGGAIIIKREKPMKTRTILTAAMIACFGLGLTACATTPGSDATAKAEKTKNDTGKAKPKKVKGGFY
jgi:hypothetical protein